MKLLSKVNRFIFNYARAFGMFDILSDEQFIRLLWKRKFHSSINLDNPTSFNEKLQWLKLHDRKAEYTTMVDKYKAKKWIADKLESEEFIIKTYNVWDKFEDIDFDTLPEKFVLKTTHDSGGVVVCKNKQKLDTNKAKNIINKSLHRNYYKWGREWPYKNVKPRIIAEEYLEEKVHTEIEGLTDYKFYCFNGEPRLLYVSRGLENHDTARLSFITMDWERAPFRRYDYMDFSILPNKPEKFEEMKKLARILSKDIPFLRVDFYQINGRVYFGELTFYPSSGFIRFYPEEYDKTMGDMLKLKEK